jgi:hypothetical protein
MISLCYVIDVGIMNIVSVTELETPTKTNKKMELINNNICWKCKSKNTILLKLNL